MPSTYARRLRLALLLGASLAMLLAGSAQAAAPTVGATSATDIQGISALLKGEVDPQGLSTSAWFEYGTASNLSGATKTASRPAGQGAGEEEARMSISGLAPDTTYYFRLVASNSSGTTTGTIQSFKTTKGFGFLAGEEGFSARVYADGGEAATVAGSHPNQLSFGVGLREGGEFEDEPGAVFSDGDLRDLRIEAPSGLILNPQVTPVCTQAAFHTPRSSPFEESRSGESCPDSTQVGTVAIKTATGERTFGLFNLEAPPGVAAELGFSAFGAPIALAVKLNANPDGSYALILQADDVPQSLALHGLGLNLWGVPWGVSHDGQRGDCLNEVEPTFPWAKCSVGPPNEFLPEAYLSLPPKCEGPLSFNATATSWQQGGVPSASAINRTKAAQPAPMHCDYLQFNPEGVGHLDNTRASAPSGFVFRLNVNHDRLTNPSLGNATPPKSVTVHLPEGTSLNPSVGAGLGVCTPDQFARESAFNGQGNGCPNNAKIGTLTVHTPIFNEQFEGDLLTGAVYLAKPDDPATSTPGAENPFDSLISIYMLAKSPQRGVMVKLAGKLVPNPQDGTLTAVFDTLPQLPYTELEIAFRSGQRSFLITPPHCGYTPTEIIAAPYGSAPVYDELSYTLLKTGVDGGPCPTGIPPFNPEVRSGAVNSNVNAFTPYFVHISRQDTEQELTSYSLTLPKGVTGKLAGVAKCSEAAIALAKTKRGFAEAQSPSCPASSQVGRTLTGYGVGSALTYTEGKLYLAGPYHGAPLSIVTINPATVGPFDLGTIVIRSAFQVDPRTAQLKLDTAASDPIPHILDGVVLHLKEIRIYADRPNFTHNPSSCEASALTSRLTGSGASFENPADDPVSSPSSFFQLLNCRILGFQPRLGVRLRGGTKRGDYPQLRVTFASRGPNDSNLKDIAVIIPRQQFLAQEHIRSICTKPAFTAERCPKESVYGSAVAYTSLLDEPLRGNVYLRSSSGALPDLVADLHSGSIRIILEGRIGPGKKGGIRAFFSDLPDEPVERFVMTLYGGKRGLLVNSADICQIPPVSNVKAIAQNNVGAVFTSKLRGQCGKKGGAGGKNGKSAGKGGRG
jgi:hypothetical protein